MRAIEFKQFGGPEQLAITDLPLPEAAPGRVVIRVHAFGVNRAETYMRSGVWGEVPRVSGIECVGQVHEDGSERLREAQPVLALMGGMGRTSNGSYAEYVSVPSSNVVPIDSALAWAELAAIPESFATAWSCLDANLALSSGQTLLVRGGTSALGQAAINIACQRGARVFATTRREARFSLLRQLGAEPLLERPRLSQELRRELPAGLDAVLDIVGTSTLFDSLTATRRGGRVCIAGFLGGHEPIESLDPVLQLPSGVHVSVFASFMLGSTDFPLEQIPFRELIDHVEQTRYRAKPAHIFSMDQIRDAHRLMESGSAQGKIVVTVSSVARAELGPCHRASDA